MSVKLMLWALVIGILVGEILIWIVEHFDFVLKIAVFGFILYAAAVALGVP